MRKLTALPTAVLSALALTSCATSPAVPSATSSSTPGPEAFLAFAHAASFGSTDFATAADDALLGLGNSACEGLGEGLSFGRVVQGFVGSDAKPTPAEAEAFARAAVTNLCPQEADALP